VIEDDADVLAYTMDALESLGYRVVATRDARAAYAALDTRPGITLLLTDIQLPGVNGPELVVAALQRRPGLAVLYTTAFPTNAIVHRGILTGQAKTLHKPFALAELAAAVRDAIDNPPG
jgi:DNA-binding NtrC family response regulator